MKILHYNCASGISGDMNLSALLDMGADVGRVVAELQKLGVEGWTLSAAKAQKMGVWGTQVDVACPGGSSDFCGAHSHAHEHSDHSHDRHDNPHDHHDHRGHAEHSHAHRSFADIQNLILSSSLSDFVKEKSLKVFQALARAEAQLHNRPISQVRFHEVGAVDSIIDIVGGVVCLELLGVEKITVGAIELGGGFARCAHGVVPVPAPATALLAEGFKCSLGGVGHEAATPTGMAFLAALADPSAPAASGRVLARGIGVGRRDCPERANILQAVLLEAADVQASPSAANAEDMFLLSANIDDMTPESVSFLCGSLFEAGCADVWQRPVYMKKSRAAVEVCALVSAALADAAEAAFFKNSTTLGLRKMGVSRKTLPRKSSVFASSLGEVGVKQNAVSGAFKAEADDVSRIARAEGVSFMEAKKKIEAEFESRKS